MMAQQPKAADAIVRSPTPVVLEIPPRDTTFQIIQQVLQAAGVPHGVEQARRTADTARIDFGRRPDRTAILDGITVREALDSIVREDPRYEWSESDGRILVRAVDARGSSALDVRVPRFAVADVSFTDALAALVHAIDRSRPAPTVIQFGVTLNISGAEVAPLVITGQARAEPPAAAPRKGDGQRLITLALRGATVLEILDAIARADGQLSWSVHYDAGGARFENATISLKGRTSSARAVSANAEREALRMRDPHRLLIPFISPLDRMLMLYVQRARIQVGIELLSDNDRPSFIDVPALDLTDVPPVAALSRMVAFDSRFDWVDSGAIFNIRPKQGHAEEPSILDQPIDTFSVADVTAEGTLDAIGRLFGSATPGGGYGEGGLIDVDEKEQRRRIDEGRAKTMSLTLANTSIREILNPICRAHGTLSWSLRPHVGPKGQRTYTIQLDSYEGWGVSKTFRISQAG